MNDDVDALASLWTNPALNGAESQSASPTVGCARCGGALAPDASESGCVRCMLRFAFAPDEQQSESGSDGLTSPSQAESRGHRYGHFTIDLDADGQPLELGHGAMGVTYRGRDTILQTPVALKVIAASVAQHPAARSRFLREARSAALLRHPNVASVFHYGERNGECFYAMELVEGETLDAKVRRDGPLSAELALDVAAQVASALAAAEARGIVHRDLKPSNLMLAARESEEDAPTVKVIDFGLAKVVSTMHVPDSGVADTRGGFVGTPAFASPEQYTRAEDERIDTRSDIYSLGITLWYLLCGKVPFVGETLTEIHRQQTRRALPLEQLKSAKVPAPVVVLLRSMLTVAPAERPQSARELLEMLHRCQRHFLVASRRRFAALAGAMALLALAVFALMAWREHTRPLPLPPDRSLAVLPFENLSADPADAYYAEGLRDQIAGQLARIATLKSIGSESTKAYAPGQRDLAQISRELGVNHLLEGSVQRSGSQLNVTIRLTDARDPAHPWTKEYRRRLPDVLILQGQISRAVAGQLRVSLSQQESRLLNDPPTNNLEAYDLYLQANEVPTLAGSFEQLMGVMAKAQSLLDAAVAKDPNFCLAYCGLANVHDSFYQYRAYQTSAQPALDHYAAAVAALDKARALRPDAPEVHLAVAEHLHRTGGDMEQARAEVELARPSMPNSPEVEYEAGMIARDQGRWPDAVRHIERWVELDPHTPQSLNELANTYHYLCRYNDYERTRARAAAFLPPEEAVYNRPSFALISLERDANLVPLRETLLSVPEAQRDASWTQHMLILQDSEQDPDGILRTLQASKRPHFIAGGCIYPKAWYEALAARMRQDKPGAEAAFTTARTYVEKIVAEDPADAMNLSVLAMIDAGLGRAEDAVREAKRACEMLPGERAATKTPVAKAHLAVVYAWTAQTEAALAELATMVGQPSGDALPIQPSYGDFKLNSVWTPLRSDARFAELTRRLAPDGKL